MSSTNDQVVKMTFRRIQALKKVRRGAVFYVQRKAAWIVDGAPMTGWDWRTLSDLRRHGLMKIGAAGKAALTEEGVTALDTLGPKPRKVKP